MSKEWTHGLFGCFDDCIVCLLAWFVPCLVQGKAAEAVGDSCILHVLLWFICVPYALYLLVLIRKEIRERRDIGGSLVKDCILVIFCNPCVLAQIFNEVYPPDGRSMARE